MGHIIKRLSCTTIFWYDMSFQSLWRCSVVEDGYHILIFESFKDAAFLVQKLRTKISWKERGHIGSEELPKTQPPFTERSGEVVLDSPIYCLQLCLRRQLLLFSQSVAATIQTFQTSNPPIHDFAGFPKPPGRRQQTWGPGDLLKGKEKVVSRAVWWRFLLLHSWKCRSGNWYRYK